MNNKKILTFLLIPTLCIFFSFFCRENSETLKNKPCDNLDILDSLVQDIFSKHYIYAFGPDDNSKIGYVMTNELIREGREYRSPFYEKIIAIKKSRMDSVSGGIFSFPSIKFYDDTTKVDIKIYFRTQAKRTAKTSILEYKLDTLNCRWKLTDSTLVWN